MRILALLLASAFAAFADGTVQQTISQLGLSDTWVVTFDWIGDTANGSVPATLAKIGNQLQGYRIVSLDVAPGTPAPTNGYSVTIKSSLGIDCFAGTANTLGSATGSSFAAAQNCSPINGAFTFGLTGNSVASAKGKIVVYVQKPTLIVQAQLAATTGANLLNIADIRTYGAICNGSDVNTAVQAAIAAGFTNIFIPAGCTWIAPAGVMTSSLLQPITYRCENLVSSVIQSDAVPGGVSLQGGPLAQAYGCNMKGANTGLAPHTGVCPIGHFINLGAVNNPVISTCYTAEVWRLGQGALNDFSGTNFVNDGIGEAIFVGTFGNGSIGIRSDMDSGSVDSSEFLCDVNVGTTRGTCFSAIDNVDNNSSAFSWFSQYKTVGNVVQFNQRTATYTGDVINLSMDDTGSGTKFTGNFLDLVNGGVQKYIVNSQGVAFFGSASKPSDRSGAGTPEGAVAACIGSTFRRTDGGAGTSLYVKESGACGGTGWVGK